MYNWFKFSIQGLPMAAIRGAGMSTLVCVSAHQTEDGLCAMSYGEIARRTGYGRRSIITGVQQLIAHNIVERVNEGRDRHVLTLRILKHTSVGVKMPVQPAEEEEQRP